MSTRIKKIESELNHYKSLIEKKINETDFKELAKTIDLNNLEKLKELSNLVNDNKQTIKVCVGLLDTLTFNLTQLREETDTLGCFINGYVKALAIELGNQREAFYWLYKALDLPYDEIKGWDINTECDDQTKKRRRPISLLCSFIRGKIKAIKKKIKGRKNDRRI